MLNNDVPTFIFMKCYHQKNPQVPQIIATLCYPTSTPQPHSKVSTRAKHSCASNYLCSPSALTCNKIRKIILGYVCAACSQSELRPPESGAHEPNHPRNACNTYACAQSVSKCARDYL